MNYCFIAMLIFMIIDEVVLIKGTYEELWCCLDWVENNKA